MVIRGTWLSFYHRPNARLDTCDTDRLLVFGHHVRQRIASWQQPDGQLTQGARSSALAQESVSIFSSSVVDLSSERCRVSIYPGRADQDVVLSKPRKWAIFRLTADDATHCQCMNVGTWSPGPRVPPAPGRAEGRQLHPAKVWHVTPWLHPPTHDPRFPAFLAPTSMCAHARTDTVLASSSSETTVHTRSYLHAPRRTMAGHLRTRLRTRFEPHGRGLVDQPRVASIFPLPESQPQRPRASLTATLEG